MTDMTKLCLKRVEFGYSLGRAISSIQPGAYVHQVLSSKINPIIENR